ncbi:MAG: hypothetical protein QW570_08245 [Candidatus Caldarchaeum sp.]
MTPEQQLDYVKKYLEYQKKERGNLKTIDDVYPAILHPAGIGKGRDYVLFKSGTKEYDLNKGLDADGDGQITVGEATARVRQIYEMGLLPETKPQESSPTSGDR